MGTKELSPSARFFEQVGNGALVEIQRSDISVNTIPASKIPYVGYDWAGRADKVVINDVTGDRYIYGEIYYKRADPDGDVTYDTVKVTNSSGSQEFTTYYMDGIKTGVMGGVALSMDKLGGQSKLAAFMPLQSVKGVGRAQFDLDNMTLTTNSLIIPVADNVECYNKASGEWYKAEGEDGSKEALKLALAFSNNLTVYYDRSPEAGGKVRVVVAE